jgi:hypothetical protein
VKTFVLFVGYPRSGHSLVGTLLDAHANMVISDERNVLIREELFNSTSVDTLFRAIITHSLFKWSGFADDAGQRVHAQDGVVRYNYSVPTMWQGKFSCLRVIGDKKGSTIPLLMQRGQTDEILKKLQLIRDGGYRIKFFHVIRNPFDNVATMTSQKLDWHSTHAKEHIDAKEHAAPWAENGDVLIKKYEFYRDLHEYIVQFLKKHVDKSDVITVYDPDLTKNPREEMKRWCKFLDVRCSQQYLDACAKGIYPHTYHSRDKFEWSSDMVANMTAWMQSMPLLKRFTFTSE